MSEFAEAFKGTNFGTTDYDKLILEALEKVACGYHNGMTISTIIETLELVEFRDGGTAVVLSDAGLEKMYELKEKRG